MTHQYELENPVNPTFGSFNVPHLDAGERIAQLGTDFPDFLHARWQGDDAIVRMNFTNRSKDGSRATQCTLLEVLDFVKSHRPLDNVQSKIVLADIDQ